MQTIESALVPQINRLPNGYQPLTNRLPTPGETLIVFPQSKIDCFVVKPAQRNAVPFSANEIRHCRLHTHTQDGGRRITKGIERYRIRKIIEPKKEREREKQRQRDRKRERWREDER